MPVSNPHRTHIASHRGGARLWSENSLSAFRNTAQLPVERVEFDIHPTADNRVVVLHDPTLDRTTNGSGVVGDKTWAELEGVLVNGTEDRLLLLEEVLDVFRPTDKIMQIEFKADPARVPYPSLPGLAVDILRQAGALERVVASSFQLTTIARLPERQRFFGLTWLVHGTVWHDVGLAGIVDLAGTHGATSVSIHQGLLNADHIAALRAAGLGVGAYAAHEDDAISRVLALDVDFFTTDRPDRALLLRDVDGGLRP